MSGSVSPAMEGSLIILAAGDKEVYDECQSCFQAMGKKSFFLGISYFSFRCVLFSLFSVYSNQNYPSLPY